MKEFLIKLISEDNNINEQIVAGYISLVLALVYIISGLFKPINIDILNSLLWFTGACFGITSFERIGKKHKEININEVKNDNADSIIN